MSETWGDEGPPEEAYSRVSRDLVAVTADFGAFLNALADSLVDRFACRVRPVTPDEAAQLGGERIFDTVVAVEPDNDGAAALLIGRATEDGAHTATFAFGVTQSASLPDCWCDACDEDSESLIEQSQRFMEAALRGCREFRRPYRPRLRDVLDGGPWMEEGCRTASGGWAHTNRQVSGRPFDVAWKPWVMRPDARSHPSHF